MLEIKVFFFLFLICAPIVPPQRTWVGFFINNILHYLSIYIYIYMMKDYLDCYSSLLDVVHLVGEKQLVL